MLGNGPKTAGKRASRFGAGPFFVLPALLLLGIFSYRPIVRTIELSFYGSDLLGNPTRFVGVDYFVEMFTEPDMIRVLGTTVLITVCAAALAIGGALFAVIPLSRLVRGGTVFSVVFSLPFAFSAAAASACFAGLFAPAVGTLNGVLAAVGVAGPPWLQSPGWAIFSIILATAWYEFGFTVLVLVAATRNMPVEVLEAARLDGAGEWRLARSIILPLISPTLLFLVVTQTISGLQIFTQVQVLTRGGPAGATQTLVYQLYDLAFAGGTSDVGRASTFALVLLVLVAGITALQYFVLNRRVTR